MVRFMKNIRNEEEPFKERYKLTENVKVKKPGFITSIYIWERKYRDGAEQRYRKLINQIPYTESKWCFDYVFVKILS